MTLSGEHSQCHDPYAVTCQTDFLSVRSKGHLLLASAVTGWVTLRNSTLFPLLGKWELKSFPFHGVDMRVK